MLKPIGSQFGAVLAKADNKIALTTADAWQVYETLLQAEIASDELCRGQDTANACWETLSQVRAAIAIIRLTLTAVKAQERAQ
jgi:hypothetical protein